MSISVIMSVYKYDKAEYLDRSLRSVWSDQTMKPDEIVLVEDGPLGDDLHHVINNAKNSLKDNLIIIVNDENLGLTKSLNKAISAAHGDYLARMDSDDISLPHRFEKQFKFMESHLEIDVLGGGMLEIDENDVFGAEREYPTNTAHIKRFIVKANPLAHPTTFIRKKVFDEGFYYDEKYRKNQDLKLWFDLLDSKHEMANLQEVVLHFRRTKDTYLKRQSKVSIKSEAQIYISGIQNLYGKFNWRLIYPVVRYAIKSMPPSINAFVYKYLFRKKNI